ncbi:MAG: 4Fe-4S binding protein [Silicimonas sp.]|nr:4Fe-4S binding protein [Silicimonas sp.]
MAKIERLLLCSCDDSMRIDARTAAAGLGEVEVMTATALCTSDIDIAGAALGREGTTLVACGQMAALFEELAEELGAEARLATVDIRDRAGWTAEADAFPKQAALLAEAALPRPDTPAKDVVSEGTCLILGRAETALAAADRLSDALAVTCLLTDTPDDIAPDGRFDIATGHLKFAAGALGGFSITVDAFRSLQPGGRGAGRFGAPKDGAKSTCDIILDLRGQAPLFPADHKREGYVRADPGDPLAVERSIAQAKDLQGVFEKPLYIRFDPTICAHSRASRTGCDRCLNVCPTGAITADGDTVAIDTDICAGCGACAAVCPSGAASYDDPPVATLFARLRTLAATFRAAGGIAPRVLFHEADWGGDMIRLSARYGQGLPADVIPVEVASVEGVGHAEILAALGVGFASVALMPGPRSDRAVIYRELALANAIAPGSLARLLDVEDPDAMEAALYGATTGEPVANPVLPLGGRRDVTRLAATALNGDAAVLSLPAGAPYGQINIDTDACTLCLACVSLCPAGALGDNPDKPSVRFQETACLQCGICANACPETAITLNPRLDLRKEALSYRTLHEEEPFECVECGTPFGVRSTIETIVEKLSDKHWMYQGGDQVRLIQMCDNCRVNAQYHQENSPFRVGDRPRVRTTDDDLRERDGE